MLIVCCCCFFPVRFVARVRFFGVDRIEVIGFAVVDDMIRLLLDAFVVIGIVGFNDDGEVVVVIVAEVEIAAVAVVVI